MPIIILPINDAIDDPLNKPVSKLEKNINNLNAEVCEKPSEQNSPKNHAGKKQ
jgi:hypothetical protein